MSVREAQQIARISEPLPADEDDSASDDDALMPSKTKEELDVELAAYASGTPAEGTPATKHARLSTPSPATEETEVVRLISLGQLAIEAQVRDAFAEQTQALELREFARAKNAAALLQRLTTARERGTAAMKT